MGFGSFIRKAAAPITSIPGAGQVGQQALGVGAQALGGGMLGGSLGGSLLGGILGGNRAFTGGGVSPAPPGTTPGAGEGGAPFNIEEFITSNPAYKFRQEEGLRGMQRTAAAKGMFGSGNLLRDLTEFSSGLAAQSYDTEVDRIMQMAGVGAGSPGTAGQVYADARGAGTGYQQEGFGALGGIFNLFQ